MSEISPDPAMTIKDAISDGVKLLTKSDNINLSGGIIPIFKAYGKSVAYAVNTRIPGPRGTFLASSHGCISSAQTQRGQCCPMKGRGA